MMAVAIVSYKKYLKKYIYFLNHSFFYLPCYDYYISLEQFTGQELGKQIQCLAQTVQFEYIYIHTRICIYVYMYIL